MTGLRESLYRFDTVLHQHAPRIASRLQPGLSFTEIEAQTTSFTWTLPQDAYDLYQFHNGLSGKSGQLNWVEKLMRLKGKWHGELASRENEIHLQVGARLIVAKFLPLNYALAGHRHLKLGRCLIDLLPFAILADGDRTIYCMMRLDPKQPTIYCADGTQLPPIKVTESFLSEQLQFSQLHDFIAFLIEVAQHGSQPSSTHLLGQRDEIDWAIDSIQFHRLYSKVLSTEY